VYAQIKLAVLVWFVYPMTPSSTEFVYDKVLSHVRAHSGTNVSTLYVPRPFAASALEISFLHALPCSYSQASCSAIVRWRVGEIFCGFA
jgi:hypothetical protein